MTCSFCGKGFKVRDEFLGFGRARFHIEDEDEPMYADREEVFITDPPIWCFDCEDAEGILSNLKVSFYKLKFLRRNLKED